MNEFFLVLTLLVAPTAFNILIPPLVLEAPVSLAFCYDFRMDFQAQSFVKMGSSIRWTSPTTWSVISGTLKSASYLPSIHSFHYFLSVSLYPSWYNSWLMADTSLLNAGRNSRKNVFHLPSGLLKTGSLSRARWLLLLREVAFSVSAGLKDHIIYLSPEVNELPSEVISEYLFSLWYVIHPMKTNHMVPYYRFVPYSAKCRCWNIMCLLMAMTPIIVTLEW